MRVTPVSQLEYICDGEKPTQPLMATAVGYLNVHPSDGRFGVQGTWADKMARFGNRPNAAIGEIRCDADFEKVPRDTRCYAVYIPSQRVIRWAAVAQAQVILGGTRHDYLNRGDAMNETNPRRGFLRVTSSNEILVTAEGS